MQFLPAACACIENGREVFRQSPAESGTAQSQVESSPEQGSGMQRAASVAPEKLAEPPDLGGCASPRRTGISGKRPADAAPGTGRARRSHWRRRRRAGNDSGEWTTPAGSGGQGCREAMAFQAAHSERPPDGRCRRELPSTSSCPSRKIQPQRFYRESRFYVAVLRIGSDTVPGAGRKPQPGRACPFDGGALAGCAAELPKA